jgi:hypothetical protein
MINWQKEIIKVRKLIEQQNIKTKIAEDKLYNPKTLIGILFSVIKIPGI